MLVDLGLSVYAEDFEKPFLTATAEFYMVRILPAGWRQQACTQHIELLHPRQTSCHSKSRPACPGRPCCRAQAGEPCMAAARHTCPAHS